MVGSAVGAWLMVSRQQRARAASLATARGTVIFDNTPRPSDVDPVV
jgi:hypothetical protein